MSYSGNRKPPIGKSVPLFFWSDRKFAGKEKDNYGDLLSKYLVEKITGRKVKWVHPKQQTWYKWNKKHFIAVGSVLHHATRESVVWGSGIIDREHKISNADFRAVRGPETRKYLLKLGYECPEVYGDPALLLPLVYAPQVEKTYRLGIIPHYHDYEDIVRNFEGEKDVLVIDMMTLNVEEVTKQILQCKSTVSSSLHGLIVSHTYSIPSIWVEFSDRLFGDQVKFADYLLSVELPVYSIKLFNKIKKMDEIESLFATYPVLPKVERVEELRSGLMGSQPFK